MKKITTLAILLLVVLGMGACHSSSKIISATWDAPTTGSPVEEYRVQKLVNGKWKTQTGKYDADGVFKFSAQIGDTVVIRVMGIDEIDRIGVPSPNSEPHVVE